ncbi:MAG: condensation domain-containing protein [Clostridia bacterium]|nr:condensation domain-containing protein [Clostridia bacterium]MDD4386576.1 condensation domain-containing protein [Clostridia bacterium]
MDNKYNLTLPQKNIYMVEKFESGTPLNTIGGTINMKSNFDEIICNKILNKLIENNDALRIKIYEEKNKIFQTVSKYKFEDVEYIDMSTKTNKETQKYMYDNIHKPFNFIDSNLYEFKIIKLKDNSGRILMKFHHIISDAWTLMQIINQFVKMYDNFMNNIDEKLVIPSYLEYISSEKEYLASDKYLQDEHFWREYLNDINYPVSIKTVTSKMSSEAGRYSVTLSKKENAKINKYCKINKTSPYTLFLAALSTYIYRTKKNNDFIIGSPILNRSNFKTKQILGMFVSTIPIRMKIKENIKFIDFVRQIGSDTMSLFRHQKYPITKSLEYIHNSTDIKGKIYNIMLSYQNARANIDNSKVFSTEWLFSGNIQNDLEIHIMDMDNEGVLTINYHYLIDLFSKIEIKYLHTRIMSIIENAIDDINISVENIRIMSKEEENKILYEFNDTDENYPKDKSVIDLFEEQVKKTPDNIAVVFEEKEMTYRELNDKANCLAKRIKFTNSVIAFTTSKSINKIIIVLGIMKSKNTLLPVDIEYPIDRIDNILNTSKAEFLITEKSEIINVKKRLNNIYNNVIDFEDDKLSNIKKVNIENESENLYLVFTSGSTGIPKGIGITNKNIINLLFSQKKINMDFKNQRVLQFATLSFDVSYQEIYSALCFGGQLVMVSDVVKKDSIKLSQYINNNHVDILFIPPVYLRAICESDENIKNIKKLSSIIVAGEQCIVNENIRNLLKGTNISLYNHYGPAETHVVTISEYKYIDINKSNKNTISIGNPINNTSILIQDDKGRILPIGVEGELNITGDSVGTGYVGNKEITDSVFSNVKIKNRIVRRYKSGDIAKFDFDSRLYYIGRKDFQIKVNGYRIEIEEIERIASTLKNVNNAVVILTTDNKLRKKINIVIEFNNKSNIEKIKKALSLKLPKYMMPHFYYEINKMPINFNGKIDRKLINLSKLTNINFDVKQKEIFDVKTKIIKKCIEEVLNSKIEINENFFDNGLDSLGAIEFQVKLLKNNLEISIQEIYDNNSIKKLVNFINTAKDKKGLNFSIPKKTVNKTILSNEKIETILLTGATGYLGVHVLKYIVENYDKVNIICLVRKKNSIAAERLKLQLSYYSPKNASEIISRIKIYEGNLEKNNFGLNESEYIDLKIHVDAIINCAALVSHYANRKHVNDSNIEPIKKLIEFCKNTNITFNHISTIGVAGNGLVDNCKCIKSEFDENDLFIGQMYNQNVYVESKILGENIIYKNMKNGLKANIVRVGNLTNRYTDYLFQKNIKDNAFQNKLLSIMKLGIAPLKTQDLEFDITPVDLCAQNLVNIVMSNTYNSVYHVFNEKTIKFSQLLKYMNKITGRDIELVSMIEFKKNINTLINNTYFSKLVQDLYIKNSNCIKVLNKITKNKGYCVFNEIDEKYYFEMFERIWKNENNK